MSSFDDLTHAIINPLGAALNKNQRQEDLSGANGPTGSGIDVKTAQRAFRMVIGITTAAIVDALTESPQEREERLAREARQKEEEKRNEQKLALERQRQREQLNDNPDIAAKGANLREQLARGPDTLEEAANLNLLRRREKELEHKEKERRKHDSGRKRGPGSSEDIA